MYLAAPNKRAVVFTASSKYFATAVGWQLNITKGTSFVEAFPLTHFRKSKTLPPFSKCTSEIIKSTRRLFKKVIAWLKVLTEMML